jgi:MEMO1 family protein
MKSKFGLLLTLFVFNVSLKANGPIIHSAHLSSSWCSHNKETLQKDLNNYFTLSQKNFSVAVDSSSVKALIVPHAGHYFSGLCAASAYQSLKTGSSKNQKIKKVIILSPSHTEQFSGVALPHYDVYRTPLGDIPVDKAMVTTLRLQKNFSVRESAHKKEHSIEIELPFLQESISDFKIVPLIVGSIQPHLFDAVSKSIGGLINDQTLVVISSDFTHFGNHHNYVPFETHVLDRIRQIDSLAFEAIQNQTFGLLSSVLQKAGATICGNAPLKILLKLIEKKFVEGEFYLSSYYTSEHLLRARSCESINIKKLCGVIPAQDIDNSVSYLGAILSSQERLEMEPSDRLTGYEKICLLKFARESIENNFSQNKKSIDLLLPVKSLGVKQRVGAFVSLNTSDGNLRGCMGQVVSFELLYETIFDMANAAAFEDPRFKPLTISELKDIKIHVTILTQPRAIANLSEIKIGTHGIILSKNGKTAVFLPQVPGGFGWDLKTTLEQLSEKAGLQKDDWKTDCQFWIFSGFEITE